MSIANVSIVGNLVRAPEKTDFPSGKIKTTLVVAVDTPVRKKNGGQPTDFYRVVVWDKFAQLVANRLSKGNQVTASGRLTIDQWIDKEGKTRVTPTISAYDIAFPQRPKLVGPDDTTNMFAVEPDGTTNVLSVQRQEIETASKKEASSNEDEDAEYEEQEDDTADDDYGEPNRATRPAPTRERLPSPA